MMHEQRSRMIDSPWILAHLPVGVWVGNVPDGSVAYANQAFEEILGRKAVPGIPIGDAPTAYALLDRQGRPYPVDQLPFGRVMATGRPTVVDDLVVRRGDRDVSIRAFGSPKFDATGRLTHVIVAFIDITREVAADAQRRTVESRLQFVCSHAPILPRKVVWVTRSNIRICRKAALPALPRAARSAADDREPSRNAAGRLRSWLGVVRKAPSGLVSPRARRRVVRD